MFLPIHVLPDGRMPTRATAGSAGLDCYAAEDATVPSRGTVKVRLGFKVGALRWTGGDYELTLRGRSGMTARGHVGHLGTIDSDYRGEVCALLSRTDGQTVDLKRGDRIAQLVVSPILLPQLVSVHTVDETSRGARGFGSTGE